MNQPPKKTDITRPELWQFPMEYPLSIIGVEGAKQELIHEVTLILAELFCDFDPATMVIKPSKTGKFHALRVLLPLKSADEVNRLYAALDNAQSVRTVI